MEEIVVREKSRAGLVIFVLLLLLVGVGLVAYFSFVKKDVVVLEQNLSVRRGVVVRVVDGENRDVGADYVLSLNNVSVASGRVVPGVVEFYNNLSVGKDDFFCERGGLFVLPNSSFGCKYSLSLKDACLQENLGWDDGCFVVGVGCNDSFAKEDKLRSRCYLKPESVCKLSDGECVFESVALSKSVLSLSAVAPDFFGDSRVCSWFEDSCTLSLRKRPDINFSIINDSLFINDLNGGDVENLSLCVGWDENTVRFSVDEEEVGVPERLFFDYMRCYLLLKNNYSVLWVNTGPSNLSLLALGSFVGNRSEIHQYIYKE